MKLEEFRHKLSRSNIKDILRNEANNKSVYSVGVLSCESPSDAFDDAGNKIEYSKEDNENAVARMHRLLRHYKYRQVTGVFDVLETSFIIQNISLEDMKRLSKYNYQKSFLYANKKMGDNFSEIGYYERGESADSPYEKQFNFSRNVVGKPGDFDSYYTHIGKGMDWSAQSDEFEESYKSIYKTTHMREWGGESDFEGFPFEGARHYIDLIKDHDYIDDLDVIEQFVDTAENDEDEAHEFFTRSDVGAALDNISAQLKRSSGKFSGVAGDLAWQVHIIMDDIDLE